MMEKSRKRPMPIRYQGMPPARWGPSSLSQRARVYSILNVPVVQPKLIVGGRDDPAEREADCIADRVIGDRGPEVTPVPEVQHVAPGLQRMCAECEEEDGTVRRQAEAGSEVASTSSHSVSSVLNSGGEPLSPSAHGFFEPRLGLDLSNVVVHHDGTAAAAATAISAKAFTYGNHIVFNRGQYQPETQRGKHLLAHELAHVMQQRGTGQAQTVRRKPMCDQVLDAADPWREYCEARVPCDDGVTYEDEDMNAYCEEMGSYLPELYTGEHFANCDETQTTALKTATAAALAWVNNAINELSKQPPSAETLAVLQQHFGTNDEGNIATILKMFQELKAEIPLAEKVSCAPMGGFCGDDESTSRAYTGSITRETVVCASMFSEPDWFLAQTLIHEAGHRLPNAIGLGRSWFNLLDIYCYNPLYTMQPTFFHLTNVDTYAAFAGHLYGVSGVRHTCAL